MNLNLSSHHLPTQTHHPYIYNTNAREHLQRMEENRTNYFLHANYLCRQFWLSLPSSTTTKMSGVGFVKIISTAQTHLKVRRMMATAFSTSDTLS